MQSNIASAEMGNVQYQQVKGLAVGKASTKDLVWPELYSNPKEGELL